MNCFNDLQIAILQVADELSQIKAEVKELKINVGQSKF